jgi:membrane dipeptidase
VKITRRTALQGIALASAATLTPEVLSGFSTDILSSFSSLDEIFKSSIIVDDLSGFDPTPTLPDAGFSSVTEAGITIVGPTLGDVEPESAFHSTIEELGKTIELISKYPSRMMLIRSVGDIAKAKQENKLGILANVQNSACIARDLKNLDLFYSLGLRQVQLTFNWRNWVGDGCTERTQAGLSYFGVDVVKRMNELGMIVDVGHTGYQSTLDAVEVSEKPIVYSHTNCKALCDHPRNKTDDQIKALARKGGVIGLSCFNWFVSDKPRSTLNDLLNHFDHVAALVGTDHIGIGSDFSIAGWLGREPDAEWESHRKIYSDREWKTIKGRFPPYIDEVNNPRRYHTIAEGLQKRGWELEDIAKILGLNFVRVYQAVLKS